MNLCSKYNKHFVRVFSIVVSFMLLTSSVPVSTYAAIQAPP
ncbi:MAG: hypothetical protein PHI40_07875 [Caldisericia bacterium]|nr:hypothetical protein [Caldisericia bacterium]